MKKVLIVGGVAGGASTATRLRRLDENLEIVIFEKGEYVSFANCGLPYYIGDIIQNRESLLVQTPESLKVRFNLDVRVNSEVVGVNGKDKKVKVKTKNGEKYEENFICRCAFSGIRKLCRGGRTCQGLSRRELRLLPQLGKIHGAKRI